MHYSLYHRVISIFLIGLLLGCSGCITLVQDVSVTPLDPASSTLEASEPNLRVHTTTGSVVLFPEGVVFTADSLLGKGRYYGLNLDEKEFVEVRSYPRDMVTSMETIGRETNPGKSVAPTVIGSLLLSGGIGIGLLAIAFSQASFGGGYCEP